MHEWWAYTIAAGVGVPIGALLAYGAYKGARWLDRELNSVAEAIQRAREYDGD